MSSLLASAGAQLTYFVRAVSSFYVLYHYGAFISQVAVMSRY